MLFISFYNLVGRYQEPWSSTAPRFVSTAPGGASGFGREKMTSAVLGSVDVERERRDPFNGCRQIWW